MKWIDNMKISVKLLLGFGIVAVLAGAIGVFGSAQIRNIEANDVMLYEKMTLPMGQLNVISNDFQKMRSLIRDLVLVQDSADIEKRILEITRLQGEIDEYAEKYKSAIISDEEQKAYDTFKEAKKSYGEYFNTYVALVRTNKDTEAVGMIYQGDWYKTVVAEQGAVESMVKIKVDAGLATSQSNTAKADSAVQTMIILTVIGVIIAFSLGWFISRRITRPLHTVVEAADKLSEGDINVKLDYESRDELGQLFSSFRSMVANIRSQASVAEAIAAGRLDVECQPRSDSDIMGRSLQGMLASILAVTGEVNGLIIAAKDGKLDKRVDSSSFKGGWKDLVRGINEVLDAVIGPLNVAAEYVDRISKGDIPPRINDSYNGDFNEIKNNLNTCIDAINLLVTDTRTLARAAVEGALTTRADARRHQGEFQAIVNGINDTLDAVIEPVSEASQVLQEMARGRLDVKVMGNYKGDHANLKEALNSTIYSLKTYVAEISEVLKEMAAGNLDVSINGDYKGDFEALKVSLNAIINAFNDVIGEINQAADQVSAGANQVADSSQSLSQAATEQASAIEQITSSVTHIALQTKENAMNANKANELAVAAREQAAQGNAQMQEMLIAMKEINDASGRISKIIKVIDEIAFQTNILALNAAVEAARAGEHGKGFAVVAEEVRNLAARSANAAKETTDMIEGSMRTVEVGTGMAQNTAEALDRIVEGISQATRLVGEIADASNQQATGVSQVDSGIGQVAEIIQMNTATSEQSAAASQQLSSQAELLKQRVARFRLRRAVVRADLLNMNPELLKVLQAAGRQAGAGEGPGQVRRKIAINMDDEDFGKY